MADDLATLEPYLAAMLARLGPAQRRRALRKMGEALRRENARRIAANVEPDGAPMEPRKPRPRMTDGKGRVRRARKMFPKIKLARAMKIRTTAEEVSVGFEGGTGLTARAHQFGLTDFVGRTKSGRVIRTRYPERRLLGFGPDDIEAVTDAALYLFSL